MQGFEVLAEAFRYPWPGQAELLQGGIDAFPSGPARKAYLTFLKHFGRLSVAQREELYTRTLDLNPLSAPYIGFQVYGESYQRGSFMARMNHELIEHEISVDGELPDHLVPVLKYLSVVEQPVCDLIEILPRSLQAMQRSLQRAEPDNPYVLLIEAVQHACSELKVEIRSEPG